MNNARPVLITTYTNPDLDGFSCAVAYGEFLQKQGKNAVANLPGQLTDEPKYLVERFGFEAPLHDLNPQHFDEIILVDASECRGIDPRIDPAQVIEIIDHRKVNDAPAFPRAKIQIEAVGAAATLIAEKFYSQNSSISQQAATLLYGAIISNTLNFQATVTTDRDKNMAQRLNVQLHLPEKFAHDMFLAKSDVSGQKLHDKLSADTASFSLAGKAISIVQLEMIGVANLIASRREELIAYITNIKQKNGLEYAFLSILELEKRCNYFVTEDINSQKILEKVLEVQFIYNVARRDGFIMRKELVPLLKEHLEHQSYSSHAG